MQFPEIRREFPALPAVWAPDRTCSPCRFFDVSFRFDRKIAGAVRKEFRHFGDSSFALAESAVDGIFSMSPLMLCRYTWRGPVPLPVTSLSSREQRVLESIVKRFQSWRSGNPIQPSVIPGGSSATAFCLDRRNCPLYRKLCRRESPHSSVFRPFFQLSDSKKIR